MEAGGKRYRILGLGALPGPVMEWLDLRGVSYGHVSGATALLQGISEGACDLVVLTAGRLALLQKIQFQVGKEEFLPIALVANDGQERVEALLHGADAAIPADADPAEWGAQFVALLRLRERNASLAAAKNELERLSVTDDLTGLHNKRWFQLRLAEEVTRVERYSEGLALILFDLDHFKRINDAHGHLFGDEMLKAFAVLLRKTFREADLLARYGGEEFAVILPETGLAGARDAAERFRKKVEVEKLGGLAITTSAGVAAFPLPENGRAEELLRFADEALYRAKREGRNRVVAHDALPVQMSAWATRVALPR